MKTVIRILALLICLSLLSACSSGDKYSDGWNQVSGFVSSDAPSETSATADVSSFSPSETESLVSSGVISSEQASSVAESLSPSSSTVSANPNDGKTRYEGTRDPFYWPFSETSIWNMPIGSNAQLQKANIKASQQLGIDEEYIVKVPAGSPSVEVKTPSSWGQRWPGSTHQGYMQVPSNFYLADAAPPNTPNNCAAFIMPDGRTIKQLEPTCRLGTGNAQIVGYLYQDVDIYGEGAGGTHYGSGLSAIGGSIRKGELTSSEPIKHAIKLNIWAKQYCYYDRSANKGYVWPADRHDSYAASGNMAYGGSNPNLRMGTLLTIPQNVTAESLGIRTEVGKKFFYSLQNYGAYISDDSAWDCHCWCVEDGVNEEVMAKYGFYLSGNNTLFYQDSMKLIEALYIVTNNSPTSIGGGGTPCKPLAPLFEQ